MIKNDYCVIGAGRFGYEVASKLNQYGKNVMIIDKDEDLINKAGKIFELTFLVDATDINSLAETNVANVRTVIVGLTNIESSIMVCTNLKELGVKDIIARAVSPVHKRVLNTLGIGRIVIPEIEVADRVALQSVFNVGVDITDLGNGFSWIKSAVTNKAIVGEKLEKLPLRDKYQSNLIMIQRKGDWIFPPKKDTTFEIGDVAVVMCHNDTVGKVVKFLNGN